MFAIHSELMRYKFASTPENYDIDDVSIRVINYIKTKIDIINEEIWKKSLKKICRGEIPLYFIYIYYVFSLVVDSVF